MTARTLIVVLVAAAWASLAAAEGVYRTIGPDGRVIFSDQPPAGSLSKPRPAETVEIAPAAVEAPSRTEPTATAPTESGATSKKAIAAKRAVDQPVAEDRTAVRDPALEGAVIGVLGIEDLVQRTERICIETLPTSFTRYGASAESWRQRNAALVIRAHEALDRDFTAQKPAVEAGLQAKNSAQMAPVVAAPAATRIKWCENSFAELDAGRMDVVSNPRLAAPLMP